MNKENRWLLVWGSQTKGEKIISLILLFLAIIFLGYLFKDGFKGEFYSSICPDYGYCSPCDMNFKIEPVPAK